MTTLSRKTIYALEAILEIAQNAGGEPAPTRAFTEARGVSRRYLEKAMQKLVRAGILKGFRGPGGGYALARDRRRVPIGEVVRLVESTNRRRKEDPDALSSPLVARVIDPLCRDAYEAMMRELDMVTLEDLCRQAVARGVMHERPSTHATPHFDI